MEAAEEEAEATAMGSGETSGVEAGESEDCRLDRSWRSNSSSWPRKLKFGAMLARLSFT